MGGIPYADLCKEKVREAFKEMKKNEHMAKGEFDQQEATSGGSRAENLTLPCHTRVSSSCPRKSAHTKDRKSNRHCPVNYSEQPMVWP
ncbi:unnamed protein product [Chondrus crispus]|uniref:Uncharacterized protein n=1 Tax=Chondrus crispus TaxID=2769 RepID=R7QV50_CHOCR|nr:unnamed protein product [Chondrus crispus]CDF41235.1 unnamed protein product [Chondrus crispus]|eukprot:XP_005711529.1 unnamed protein product [Chondrus crispus]